MDQQETLYAIALTRLNYFSLAGLTELYDRLGSATAVMDCRKNIREVLPDASDKLVAALADMSEPLKRAEAELDFNISKGIKTLVKNDPDYPQRLRECPDAPLVLFYRGTADLNRKHIVSIVGTRHATVYGQDIIRRFCMELRELCPDILVVSGLAYGIDICAHRNSLDYGFETVAVMAHGQDQLYPPRHAETAIRMLTHGGLLTEFTTGTRPDKMNFVKRNRIVAGISDATILVESAAHGGGLITTSIARSYSRDVFAFPGAVGAPYSEGCNNLIRDNGAALITCAADFVKAMNWTDSHELDKSRRKGIERQLFPELTAEEQIVVHALSHDNDQQINMLTVHCNLPVAKLNAILFSLEMKGVVRTLAGGIYHLLN